VIVATYVYDGTRVPIQGYVGTSDPVNRWDPSGLDYIDYEGEDVYWVVQEDGYTYNEDKARYKIGTRTSWQEPGMLWGTNTAYGSTVSILPEFGGGSVNASELETFASRSWQRYSDISGHSSGTQQALIKTWLRVFDKEGVRIGFWEGGNTVAALEFTGNAALGVGQGALNTIDGAKNTILAIPDLPRNVWNAGVWWNAKAYSLVGLNDGVPDMWIDGDWSIPQAEWMYTWNDDLLVNEGETSRAWSEGLGGAGAVMLLPLPKLPKWGRGAAGSPVDEAAAIARQANQAKVVEVSRWGRPGLEAGDFVMTGGKGWWNYFWSGKWQRGFGNRYAPRSSGETFQVPKSALAPPSKAATATFFDKGPFGWIKSLLGQRTYRP